MEEKTINALRWIVGLLQKHGIPFQIGGGFAAKLYGSQRALHDIGVGIPDGRFEELLPELHAFITYGPGRYTDEEWDLKLISLNYHGQEIDIAGRDTINFFDKETKQWVAGYRDLSKSEIKDVYGILVPVIPKAALISYKKKIGRDVDLADVAALE